MFESFYNNPIKALVNYLKTVLNIYTKAIKLNKEKVQYTIMSQALRFILSQKGYKNTSHGKSTKVALTTKP